MGDITQQITEARKHGYSDDDIAGYLGTSHPDLAPKIKEARTQGYGSAEILSHLGGGQPQTWADKLGVSNAVGKGIIDAAEGAASGAASTVFHGGDIIRRGLGMNRVIDNPDVKQAMAAPDTLMGKAGKLVEQGAEFAIPGAAGLKAAKGAGLAARMGVEALGAGGTALVQSGGDPGAAVGGALAGAAGPAIGSALEATGGALANGHIPQKLYQSALKPGKKAVLNGTADKAIDYALKEGVPVSGSGLEKLHGLVDDLNKSIQDKITTGAQHGVTIDPNAVAQRTNQLRSQFSKQVNPTADLNAIDNATSEFLNGPGAGPIPADLAQQMKQGTYQQVRKSYGQLSSAQVEAQKALARGLKEELASAFPEIGSLNAEESKALGLEPLLESAIARIGNHQMFGIGTPIAAAGVHAATGSAPIAATLGAARAIIDNPAIKSRIAIAMTRAGKGSQATLPAITARMNALKAVWEEAASKMAEGQTQPSGQSVPALAQ